MPPPRSLKSKKYTSYFTRRLPKSYLKVTKLIAIVLGWTQEKVFERALGIGLRKMADCLEQYQEYESLSAITNTFVSDLKDFNIKEMDEEEELSMMPNVGARMAREKEALERGMNEEKEE